MKIVVCIKQVPDTAGGVKFNPDGTLDRSAMLAIMNPDDKAGLEAALRLKDMYGAEVTVLTMGLPKADSILREAMAMGADNAILVTDRVLGGADDTVEIAGAFWMQLPLKVFYDSSWLKTPLRHAGHLPVGSAFFTYFFPNIQCVKSSCSPS